MLIHADCIQYECLACKEDEFQCSDGLCIWANWKCDGWDDCNDLSDELNCSEQYNISVWPISVLDLRNFCWGRRKAQGWNLEVPSGVPDKTAVMGLGDEIIQKLKHETSVKHCFVHSLQCYALEWFTYTS